MSLVTRMKAVFADAFETTPDQIDENLSVESSDAWDSMRSIVLAHGLEDEFGIEFTDDELIHLDNFSAIHATLLDKGVEP